MVHVRRFARHTRDSRSRILCLHDGRSWCRIDCTSFCKIFPFFFCRFLESSHDGPCDLPREEWGLNNRLLCWVYCCSSWDSQHRLPMAAKHKPPIIKLIIIIVPFWWFVTRAKVEWVFVNLCHKMKTPIKKLYGLPLTEMGGAWGCFVVWRGFVCLLLSPLGCHFGRGGRSGTEFERVGVER